MKILLKRLLPIALSAAVILPTTSAFAAPYVEGSIYRWGKEDVTIELRRITEIYNDPTDPHPIAHLAPQTIKGYKKRAEGNGDWGHWYLVETWLGDKWIYAVREIVRDSTPFPNTAKVGTPTQTLEYFGVSRELYDDPFEDAKSVYALAPQTVEVIDKSDNPNGGFAFFKIKTWVGEKWVRYWADPSPRI